MCGRLFFIITNILNECVLLSFLEYITKFHYLSRICLFQRILRILFDHRKNSSSKVLPYDVIGFQCVSRVGVDHFLYIIVLINYEEFEFQS